MSKLANIEVKITSPVHILRCALIHGKSILYAMSHLISMNYEAQENITTPLELLKKYVSCDTQPKFSINEGGYLKLSSGEEFYFTQVSKTLAAAYILSRAKYVITGCMCFGVSESHDATIELTGTDIDLAMFFGMIKVHYTEPIKSILASRIIIQELLMYIIDITVMWEMAKYIDTCAITSVCVHKKKGIICPFGYVDNQEVQVIEGLKNDEEKRQPENAGDAAQTK